MNSELNACAEVLTQRALKEAAEADMRMAAGGQPRALEGLPIVVKCNIDVAGTLSTASMPGLATWRPPSTAPVASKLIEAGAIVVAKTSMPELALFGLGFSPLHGLTLNPINRGVTCSGSSSGTAVCIAAGIVTCGLGTDTGGSLRMPADACGVVGFRPSLGRWPTSGIVPADPTRDTPGPMGTTVTEVMRLDSVVTGTPLTSYTPANLQGLRVAVPAASASSVPGYKQALEISLAALRTAGASVNVEAEDFTKMAHACKHERDLAFGALEFDSYLASHPGCGLTTGGVLDASFHKGTKEFLTDPNAYSLTPPRAMLHELSPEERKPLVEKHEAELKEHEARYSKYFDDARADVLLLPAGKGPPPKCLSEDEYKALPDQKAMMMQPGFFPHYSYGMQLTRLHVPSIALPTAARHEGLDVPGPPPPAGVLLFGRPEDDLRLLRVALALEAALMA